MVSLTIFCSNSINILAGVNGLEAGQTFIVACAVLLHNLVELSGGAGQVRVFSRAVAVRKVCCAHLPRN